MLMKYYLILRPATCYSLCKKTIFTWSRRSLSLLNLLKKVVSLWNVLKC